jgi:molybdenum cofactor biosynthesis protein B
MDPERREARCSHKARYVRPVSELVQLSGKQQARSARGPGRGPGAPDDRLRAFLPTSQEELDARGWDAIDILIINGDAYVDHPAFGGALIGRFLEARGFRVGMIAQPDWNDPSSLLRLGVPRVMVGITAGNLDSMLNKLTAQKKVRSDDQYSPGGKTGSRPNRASIVYSNLARAAFGKHGVPIILGGIEASLRRIAHYDYWSDQVRRGILLDAKADMLIFGMAERPVWEVAERLRAGETISQIRDVRGTSFVMQKGTWEQLPKSTKVRDGKPLWLPSYEEVSTDLHAFSEMSGHFQKETNPGNGRVLIQPHGDQALYFNPPAEPLDTALMDELYDMPFQRAPHFGYTEKIPAFETVKHSIVTMRGCFGGCSFCSITEHEGRVIQSRSAESVLREVRALRRMGDYRGVISDVGGPTANMYQMKCREETIERSCRRLSCLHPKVCENLVTDHQPLVQLLKKVREEDGVKKVFIASGVRYDLAERSPEFVRELAKHHTGGQLSVAPEHVDDDVLDKMKKPGAESYERFADMFACATEDAGKDQHLVPYYISGHPGSTLAAMIKLALYLKERGLRPRQVQDFIPTPMSMATSMYYTGLDPQTQKPVYTAKSLREKRMQKALLQYWDVTQHDLAREALIQAKRGDLIGSREQCLVPPATGKGALSIHERRKQEAGREGAQGRLGKRGAGTRPAGRPGAACSRWCRACTWCWSDAAVGARPGCPGASRRTGASTCASREATSPALTWALAAGVLRACLASISSRSFVPLRLAILTVSDTRTLSTDTSGGILEARATEAGHHVVVRRVVPDLRDLVEAQLLAWADEGEVDVTLTTGGTGLTERDITPEAVHAVCDKLIPGFGEVFRTLSMRSIGLSTLQSRATAGVCRGMPIFALPGSNGACRDAWDEILVHQLDIRYRPCNLAEIAPRLRHDPSPRPECVVPGDAEQLRAQLLDALSRGDAAALHACFAEEATLLAPGHAPLVDAPAREAWLAALPRGGEPVSQPLGAVSYEPGQLAARDVAELRLSPTRAFVMSATLRRRQGRPVYALLHLSELAS